MDKYRVWFSGMKRALLYQDDQTLHSAINIAATTLSDIPEEVRGSTFVGQPGVLQMLLKLRRALISGQNTDELKTALSNQIRLWERTKSAESSPRSNPSPPAGESSHVSAGDLARTQTQVHPVAARRVPGEGFGTLCENCVKCNGACIRIRGASCRRECSRALAQLKQSQNAVADERAAKSKNNDLRMGQEDGDEWTEKLAQNINWRKAIDGKLQTILDLLSDSLRIGPSQTVAGDNLVPYIGSDEGRSSMRA